jgi:hypothetical protein
VGEPEGLVAGSSWGKVKLDIRIGLTEIPRINMSRRVQQHIKLILNMSIEMKLVMAKGTLHF